MMPAIYSAIRVVQNNSASLNQETRDAIHFLAHAAIVAEASLSAMADDRFTSCRHEDQYAGGVVSPGNRIFTPAEAAQNALDEMAKP